MSAVMVLALASSALAAMQLDLGAALRLEGRSTAAATAGDPEGQRSEVTPTLSFEAKDRRTDATLHYGAALAAADPLGLDDPSVLHEGAAALERRLSRTDFLRLDVAGIVGDLDYERTARHIATTGDLIATF